MLDWRRGCGVNLPWVYVHCAIYMKPMWCHGFPDIYAQLEEGCWVNLPWVYEHCPIYETYLV